MEVTEHICRTPEETYALGVEIGNGLSGGETILLSGPLGAGKTLFTKGLLHGLGFDTDEVNSPSFTLVNFYDARVPVYHIDLWRIEDPSAAAATVGLHDLLEEDDAVIVVEWAERLAAFAFPGRVIQVRLEGDGDDPRRLTISEVVTDGGSNARLESGS